MAQKDGTGPQGLGPMTGRGLGQCGGGRGINCGFRFGHRRFFSKKNVLVTLEEERGIIEEELKALNEEIQALKKDS